MHAAHCCIAYIWRGLRQSTAPRRHVTWLGFRADTAARVASAHALKPSPASVPVLSLLHQVWQHVVTEYMLLALRSQQGCGKPDT
jgi:hypothetical protein